jgi:hypothetical protein
MPVVMIERRTPKRELSDHEADAVRAKLSELVDVLGTKRAVGEALGFPPRSDSQAVEKAIRVRPGREMAERLYAYLKTTREAFLGGPAISLAAALKEENWQRVGLAPDAAKRFVAMLEEEIAQSKLPAPDRPSRPQAGGPATRRRRSD